MKKPNLKQQYRVNEQIRGVREVRIVGDDIASSVVSISTALQIAEQKGVDLVEISPNAEPPVCRLIDYSKFIYQQKKHQKEIKAKQVKVDVKEIRFGPQTDDHDYNFKLKHIPYMLIVGEKEQEEGTVSFRQRGGGEQGTMKYEDFAKKIVEEVRKMTEKC